MLDYLQIDINDVANGVAIDPRIHHGKRLHSHAGIDEVFRRIKGRFMQELDRDTQRDVVLEELRLIGQEIASMRFNIPGR